MSSRYKLFSKYILLFLLLFCVRNAPFAQNNFGSEEELKKQANKLFEGEDYVAAYPLYSQLVSLYPKDPVYNYKLGVCMLNSGGDREAPIPYLEFASQKKEVDKEVFFYLGKVYQLNYRFDNAIAAFNNFKKTGSKSQIQKLEVDLQIAMCNNGKTLLKNITDLVVLDKKELSEAEFFRSYDLNDIGGKLLVKPDEFKSPIDKKKKEKSIVYLSKKNDQIFYSSYGTDGKRGRDIYFIRKQPNGEWSQPQTLPSVINTEFDEDYPFLHPNGKSLYFCSKGHNSMGGYDIFKSAFDEKTNTWSNAVNLDFAINTPDDDILYVTDSLEKTAYFSSSRLSANGMTAVFKIKVDRKPVDASIINGTFVKAGEDKRLEAKITVKNIDKNELIGIFNTNGADGAYSLQLPNGGNFLFTVESEGYNSQSETVVVPAQNELKPLKQTISYEIATGKLLINNYFDEPISESNYLLALNLIKEKAKLEVSAGGPELFIGPNSNSLDASGTESGEIKTSGNKKLSNDELVKIASEDAEDAQKEAKDLRAEADLAKSIADRKNEEAQSKSKEADQVLSSALTIQDQAEKQTQINKGNTLKRESESLSKETVVAYNLAKKLDNDAIAKQEEADLSMKYAKDLENAVKSADSKDALAKLETQKNKLEDISKQPLGTDNAYQSIKKDIENKGKQTDKLADETREIYQEIPRLEEEAKKLRADAQNTKKDDLKQGMLDQAKEIDEDVVKKKKQVEENDVKIKQLEGETETLKSEAELVNKLIGEIKTESGTSSTTAMADNKTAGQTSTQTTTPPDKGQPPPVKTIETSVNYPDKYSKELNEAEKIPDEYDREIAKSNTSKAWAEAIKKDIEKKKEQIKIAKTDNQKQALTKQVAQLDQQLKEKEKQQQESAKKAENIKQQPVAQNNPTQTTAATSSEDGIGLADYSQKYESQLKDTVNIASPYEKEIAKAKANKEYADAIDRNVSSKKENLISTTDGQAKINLEKEIKNLEQQSQEKRKLAEESSVKADQLKSQEGIAQNASVTTTASTSISSGKIQPEAVVTIATAVDYSDKYSQELVNAGSISNEYDREIAKANANKQWAEAINKDITKKKEQVKTAKTPGQKQAITNKINQLEQQLKEKEKSQQESTAKAQQIKQEELAAANYSEKYSKQLADTVQISNAYDREIAKANISKKWADAIDDDIVKKKEKLDVEKDVQVQASLKNEIANLEQQSKEKKKSSEELTAKAEQIKQHEELVKSDDIRAKVEETANASEIPADYENTYAKELNDANKNSNEFDKEYAKAVVNKKWSNSLESDIEKKKTILKSTKKKKEKTALNQEIVKLEQELQGKQSAQQESLAKLDDLKQQELAKNTSQPTVMGGEYVYTTTEAAQQTVKIQPLLQESKNLKNQAYTERQDAGHVSDPVEKNKKLERAGELEKQADQKQIEAEQISGEANKTEFLNNNSNLDELVKKSADNKTNELSVAELSKDEAQVLFGQAQKLREESNSSSDVFAKKGLLENANNKEVEALEKQKKAKDIYVKYYPDYVFNNASKPETITTPLALNTATTDNKSSVKSGTETPVNTTNTTAGVLGSAEKENSKPKENIGQQKETSSSQTSETASGQTKKEQPDKNTEKSDDLNLPVKKETSQQISNEKLEEIKAKKEYKDFSALRAEAEAALKDAKGQYMTAEELRRKGEEQIKQSQEILSQADGIKDENKKQEAYQNAIQLANEAKINLAKSDSIYEFAKNTEAAGNSKKEEAKLILQTVDKETADGMLALVGEKPEPELGSGSDQEIKIVTLLTPKDKRNKNVEQTTGAVASNSNIKLLPGESYSLGSSSIYSASNPIPIDQKLPEGLIFKVQLGAFKSAIRQDLFKGITPIMGETTPQGFIRYSVGIFVKFETADAVKNEVKGFGFRDAFVVAFYNGKRIPINDALARIGKSDLITKADVKPETASAQVDDAKKLKAETLAAETAQVDKNGIESVKATDLADVSGLIYTVQVGVYSKNSKANKLKKINPLYKENLPGGNIRFTTGKYTDISIANITRNSVVLNNGIKDAFVTAYYNGKRISIAEAKKLQNTNAPAPAKQVKKEVKPVIEKKIEQPDNIPEPIKPVITNPVTEEPKKQEPETNSNPVPENNKVITNTNTPPVNENNVKVENNVKPVVAFPSDTGVVYRVQIGAYRGQVPNDIATKYLKISKQGIKNYKDENGLTIYTVGYAKTYQGASVIKQEALNADIKDTFIIAFYYGQKITVVEAQTILNE